MKKVFAFIAVGVFAFQTSVAFAAIVQPVSSVEPAVQSLFGFNRWLMGNNNFGINYINNNFEQAYHQAKAWDEGATIGFVEITYQQPGPAQCVLEFGSVNKPHEVFKVECIDPTKINAARGYGVQVASTLTPANFFDVPVVKLRSFVVQIFSSSEMMKKVREQMHGTSLSKLDFTLSKSGDSSLWSWGVSDGKKHGLHVFVDAMSADPTLMFEGQ